MKIIKEEIIEESEIHKGRTVKTVHYSDDCKHWWDANEPLTGDMTLDMLRPLHGKWKRYVYTDESMSEPILMIVNESSTTEDDATLAKISRDVSQVMGEKPASQIITETARGFDDGYDTENIIDQANATIAKIKEYVQCFANGTTIVDSTAVAIDESIKALPAPDNRDAKTDSIAMVAYAMKAEN